MRKTKIICTIGPATDSQDMLTAMAGQGMNVARLNMSHGSHSSHQKIIDRIKNVNQSLTSPVAILMDTQGPEIRTGNVSEDFQLTKGDKITVSVRGTQDVEQSSLQINYADLIQSVAVGDRITVDNGLINLQVLEKFEHYLECEVEDGGVIKSKRHVNLPGIRVNLPAITEKDKRDVQFAIDNELDFIALSFVRSADDVKTLKTLLEQQQANIKIIAKIEDQEGVRNIDAIIQEADAIMVARGDLGVEISIEQLPNVQRKIVERCAIAGKPVIVATHLLESMIENPIPTRAEVTDVANAVYEEVDAVMLSGETTVGKHPLKCIEYLQKVALASEASPGLNFSEQLANKLAKQQLAKAAVQLADSINAKGILVITKHGKMATFASSARPKATDIFAFTFSKKTQRAMALLRAVQSYCIKQEGDAEVWLQSALEILRDELGFAAGDQFVVISDVLLADNIDAIQLRTIH